MKGKPYNWFTIIKNQSFLNPKITLQIYIQMCENGISFLPNRITNYKLNGLNKSNYKLRIELKERKTNPENFNRVYCWRWWKSPAREEHKNEVVERKWLSIRELVRWQECLLVREREENLPLKEAVPIWWGWRDMRSKEWFVGVCSRRGGERRRCQTQFVAVKR